MNEPQRKLNKKGKIDGFNGFYRPYATSIPDNFFDKVMSHLSESELKVILYIMRRTFGFKKDQDKIAISQMVNGITKADGEVLDEGTGLGKASVIRATKSLTEKGLIVKNKHTSREFGFETTTFSLLIEEERKGRRAAKEREAVPLSQIETSPYQKDTSLVSNRDIQDIPTGYTEITVNGSTEALKNKKIKGELDLIANKQLKRRDHSAVSTSAKKQSPLQNLPNLKIDQDEIEATAEWILEQMGDSKSTNFYYLVATKVPRLVVAEHLGNIKTFGAKNPPSLFNHRMSTWAEERLVEMKGKERLAEIRAGARSTSDEAGKSARGSMQPLGDLL